MRTRVVNIVTIAIAFLIGGLFTYCLIDAPFTKTTTNTGNGVCYSKCTNKVTIDEKGISEAVAKIYDAVVMIQNYQNNQLASTGTGFVYKIDEKYGYIMTNQHVVAGGQKIVVILSNDEEIDGEVLGGDTYLDLAVVRIPKDKVLAVSEIGNSEEARLGDTVFTVGTPLGYEYRGSVSGGRLSGKDRMVSVSVSGSNSNDWVMKVLQTDAAVNPGNSGGPLVNSNGEVIGIISLKLVQEEIEGMGFAIPIEYAMSHIEILEQGKAIERPLIGISMLDIHNNNYALYQQGIMLDQSITSGVVVVEVQENTAAASAKLQKGDVITKINKEIVKNSAYLRYELYKYSVGDTIEITYLRDGKEMTAKVKLTKASS